MTLQTAASARCTLCLRCVHNLPKLTPEQNAEKRDDKRIHTKQTIYFLFRYILCGNDTIVARWAFGPALFCRGNGLVFSRLVHTATDPHSRLLQLRVSERAHWEPRAGERARPNQLGGCVRFYGKELRTPRDWLNPSHLRSAWRLLTNGKAALREKDHPARSQINPIKGQCLYYSTSCLPAPHSLTLPGSDWV